MSFGLALISERPSSLNPAFWAAAIKLFGKKFDPAVTVPGEAEATGVRFLGTLRLEAAGQFRRSES